MPKGNLVGSEARKTRGGSITPSQPEPWQSPVNSWELPQVGREHATIGDMVKVGKLKLAESVADTFKIPWHL